MDQPYGHVEVVRVPKVALVGLIATLVRPQLPGVLAERAATKMIDQLVNQSARLIAEQDRWATEKAVRQFLLPGKEPQPSEDEREGPPRPLPHVIPGMQLGDEHRWILARYEKQVGRLDPGTILTAARVNEIVDWWNAGAAAAAGPSVSCGTAFAECEISAGDPDYSTDANGNHEGLCCEDCQHRAESSDDGSTTPDAPTED